MMPVTSFFQALLGDVGSGILKIDVGNKREKEMVSRVHFISFYFISSSLIT